MTSRDEQALSKVPQVTLLFWIIKIAATTLGETGGDAVSMSMNLGYLVGTAIFAVPSGGLALSRYSASIALLVFVMGCILLFPQRASSKAH